MLACLPAKMVMIVNIRAVGMALGLNEVFVSAVMCRDTCVKYVANQIQFNNYIINLKSKRF